MGWKPFKKPLGGKSSFVRQAAPYIAPFVLPGIGAAIGGDLGAGLSWLGNTAQGAIKGVGNAFGIGGGAGNAWTDTGIAGGGGGAAGGGNVISQILGNIPGDVGNFFKSNVGGTIMDFFQKAGGNIGKVGTLLDRLGISGEKKDMVEDMLTVAGLTALGQVTAKDAIATAQQYENQQKSLTQSLVNDAQKFSDPAYIEANVQKAQADINRQYGNARQAEQQNLYARGMGDRMPGQIGTMSADQAAALSGARQNIELNAPLQAMNATNMALGPVSRAAQYSRNIANEQAQLPVDTWLQLKAINANSPLDDYYRYQLQHEKDMQTAADNANAANAPGGANNPYNASTYPFNSPMPPNTDAGTPNYNPTPFQQGWGNFVGLANNPQNYNDLLPPAPTNLAGVGAESTFAPPTTWGPNSQMKPYYWPRSQ